MSENSFQNSYRNRECGSFEKRGHGLVFGGVNARANADRRRIVGLCDFLEEMLEFVGMRFLVEAGTVRRRVVDDDRGWFEGVGSQRFHLRPRPIRLVQIFLHRGKLGIEGRSTGHEIVVPLCSFVERDVG